MNGGAERAGARFAPARARNKPAETKGSPRVRVVGVGNSFAGDDGAGIEVIRRLREHGVSPDVELVEAADAGALFEALRGAAKAVVVDAAVPHAPGRPLSAGTVLRLTPDRLAGAGLTPLSTHGIRVADAIRLAQVVNPETVARTIVVIAILVEPKRCGYTPGLSAATSEAVDRAVRMVQEECERPDG